MALTSGQLEILRRQAANKIVIKNPEVCHYCGNKVALDQEKCTVCDFPQNGMQEEMRFFLNNKRIEKRKQKEAEEAYTKRIKKAKWISIVLGALFILGFAIETEFFDFYDPIVYGIYIFFIISFFTLGALTMKYPKVCTVTTLVLYLFWIVVIGIVDPTTIIKGFLIKLFIIAGLGYAAKEAFLNAPPSKKPYDENILDDSIFNDAHPK